MAKVFEYVVWFRNDSLSPDGTPSCGPVSAPDSGPDDAPEDQDREWPGVLFILAPDRASALAWGDELAKTCADQFLRSSAESWTGPIPPSGVVVPYGERPTADELGW